MKRSFLLLIPALALAAASRPSRAQDLGWDSVVPGAASPRELIRAQAAPSAPAPAASASGSAAAAPAVSACSDGAELKGRAMEVTLLVKGAAQPLVLKLAYDGCEVEYPRDEPAIPPYARRAYKSADGAVLGVYTGSDRPTSTVSLRLGDGSSAAGLIPPMATAALASGKPIDLGEILLVKTTNGSDGVVIHAQGSIKSVAPAAQASLADDQPVRPDPCPVMFRDYGTNSPSQFAACEDGYGGSHYCLPYSNSPEWYACQVGYSAFTGQ
jgi:hypothetical protein